jgi:hypothetical protein
VAEQAYAYVTLIPVAKGFQSAVAKEMGGVNNVGKKAGADAGTGFKGGFGGAIKGLVGLAAGALAAAGVGSFVKESISQASDLGESLNALQVTYKDLGGSAVAELERIGAEAANTYGLSQTQFNGFAVQFSSFAGSIAGDGGDVVGTLESITGRAADFASVMNLEVGEAAAIFQSGLAGETEPLKKFGIDLSAAAVEAYAMANGIGTAGKQLTEQEKIQARYGALMEQTSKTQGDFANTSDGLANAQRILGANFENVQATVGGPLLNAFASLTTALIPVTNELGPILVGVMEQLSPVIERIAGMLPFLIQQLFPLIPVVGDLAEIFFQLVQALLPFFVSFLTVLIPIVSELIPIFVDFVDAALEPLMDILYTLLDALVPLISALLPVFGDLMLALAPVVLDLVGALVPLIYQLLPLFISFIEFLSPILIAVGGIIGELLVFAIETFVGALDMAMGIIDIFSTFFENTFGGLGDFFYGIINGFIGAFEGFTNGIIKGVNFIIDALNRIQVDAPDWVTALTGFTSFGFNISRIREISLPRIALAEGGLVTGPTNALIGEAGPEVVIPLDRFERMMGDSVGGGRAINYYAAPNKSFDAEQELRLAMQRVRVLA